MKSTYLLSYLTTPILILSLACDRTDPESPTGDQGAVQDYDTILVKDPDRKVIGSSDAIDVELEPEPEVQVGEPPEEEANTPVLVAQTYSKFRINVTEMKEACPGNTVNIERLRFKVGGEFLVDTFASYPNDPDPKYNEGKVGVYDAKISTSGDYKEFFAYEAFGGGFGAGWWSTQNSFANQTPSPALIPVWYEVNFNQTQLKIDSMFINGGSTALGTDFEPCSPQSFSITGSNDGLNWEVLADIKNLDTENGVEIFLKYPLIAPQS